MKSTYLGGGTLGLLAIAALTGGCSDKAGDCNANLSCSPYNEAGAGGRSSTGGTSGSSGSGGGSAPGGRGGSSAGTGGGAASGASGVSGGAAFGDAGAAGSGVTPVCDGTLTPDADECVISDDYALFVSPEGKADATADGTIAHPYNTVTLALSHLGTLKKRVYVCAADYQEPGMLEIPDRAEIYGGFTCEGGGWSYDASLKAQLLPASPVGATITSASHNVTLQDVRIDAQNAPEDGTGASSFGLIVKESKGVLLRRVEIRAGKGGLGKAGENGATGADGLASGTEQNGKAGTCASLKTLSGGVALDPVCMSLGGNGAEGSSSAVDESGDNGSSGAPKYSVNFGVGETKILKATAGSAGADGAAGGLGTAAAAVGPFIVGGYSPANGGSGTSGKPGQGGGGGGASRGSETCVGSSGGAGGMGGCGGDPGVGGKGGGASVALLSWSSEVSLDKCSLSAANGGAGGNGGAGHIGGVGAAGGAGGAAVQGPGITESGGGGKGGLGGNGGSGAGGSGGPSIALVYRGSKATTLSGSTLKHGVGGAFGKGGLIPDSMNPGPDGQVGLAADEYEVP